MFYHNIPWLWPRQPPVYRDKLKGVYEVGINIQQHVSIMPGFPQTWVKRVCVMNRMAGEGSGWQAAGEGYVNASWQGGLFSVERTHTLHFTRTGTRKHAHPQTSSRRCREALRDAIKWSRGTSFSLLQITSCCYSAWMLFPLLNPSWWAAQWKRQSSVSAEEGCVI